jgi:hypothetical protein
LLFCLVLLNYLQGFLQRVHHKNLKVKLKNQKLINPLQQKFLVSSLLEPKFNYLGKRQKQVDQTAGYPPTVINFQEPLKGRGIRLTWDWTYYHTSGETPAPNKIFLFRKHWIDNTCCASNKASIYFSFGIKKVPFRIIFKNIRY